jgi:hypothetical protein
MLQEYFLYFIAIVIKKEVGWALPSFGIDMTEPRSLNSRSLCILSRNFSYHFCQSISVSYLAIGIKNPRYLLKEMLCISFNKYLGHV